MVDPYLRADLHRPDVNRVTGYAGDYGLLFVLPWSAPDGKAHMIKLSAVDVSDSPGFQLVSPPKYFQVDSALPRGFVDAISGATAPGWADDSDSPTTPLTATLHLDASSWADRAFLGETMNRGITIQHLENRLRERSSQVQSLHRCLCRHPGEWLLRPNAEYNVASARLPTRAAPPPPER